MLFKKKGLFDEEDAMKVVEIASRENAGEIIVMCERITESARRRLWDYVRGVQLMSDLTGDKREVRVEILEGYVSDRIRGVEL
ncbi:hypothetical protein JCM16138_13170 [Thermococcus atlanticus]